jgi:hypothetical protein
MWGLLRHLGVLVGSWGKNKSLTGNIRENQGFAWWCWVWGYLGPFLNKRKGQTQDPAA